MNTLSNTENQIRSFSSLHQDVWQIFLKAPLIFIFIPTVLYFPFDWLLETIVQNIRGNFLKEVRVYLQYSFFIELFVGSWITCIIFSTIEKLLTKKDIILFDIIKNGNKHYGNVVGAIFSASWRIIIGLILLVLPGIYLSFKYILATPVAFFENSTRHDAVVRSKKLMNNSVLKVFSYVLFIILIYLPGFIGLYMFIPEDSNPVIEALFSIPANILGTVFLIMSVLIYLDLSKDRVIENYNINEKQKIVSPSNPNSIIIASMLSILFFAIGLSYLLTFIK